MNTSDPKSNGAGKDSTSHSQNPKSESTHQETPPLKNSEKSSLPNNSSHRHSIPAKTAQNTNHPHQQDKSKSSNSNPNRIPHSNTNRTKIPRRSTSYSTANETSNQTPTPSSSSSAQPSTSNRRYHIPSIQKVLSTTDYYEILGVDPKAPEKQIKLQYKRIAIKLHPDKNKDPKAMEAFKKLSEAYSCLTDSNKRRQYDLCGRDANRFNQQQSAANQPSPGFHRHSGSPFTGGGIPFDMNGDITPDELFRFFAFGIPPSRTRRRRQTSRGPQFRVYGTSPFGTAFGTSFPPRQRGNSSQREGSLRSIIFQLVLVLFVVFIIFGGNSSEKGTYQDAKYPSFHYQPKFSSSQIQNQKKFFFRFTYSREYSHVYKTRSGIILFLSPKYWDHRRLSSRNKPFLKKMVGIATKQHHSILSEQCNQEKESQDELYQKEKAQGGLFSWSRLRQIRSMPLPACSEFRSMYRGGSKFRI